MVDGLWLVRFGVFVEERVCEGEGREGDASGKRKVIRKGSFCFIMAPMVKAGSGCLAAVIFQIIFIPVLIISCTIGLYRVKSFIRKGCGSI
jgi:hypothetical protein